MIIHMISFAHSGEVRYCLAVYKTAFVVTPAHVIRFRFVSVQQTLVFDEILVRNVVSGGCMGVKVGGVMVGVPVLVVPGISRPWR